MPLAIRFTTASPERWAQRSRLLSADGGAAEPGRLRPSASPMEAIVFAVYIPPQAPSPGQIALSIRSKSSSLSLPALQAPTASKASIMVTCFSVPSVSFTHPGAIEPAYKKTADTSKRAAAIIIPGSDLSQPARSTAPSSRSASITVSTESAMTSRETREKCIPS